MPLLGERGLLPVAAVHAGGAVPGVAEPVLLLRRRTRPSAIAAWSGVALVVARAHSAFRSGAARVAAASVWALLWLLYLSFVNVGQTFYGFGWESLLLEAGFFAIFARRRARRRRPCG